MHKGDLRITTVPVSGLQYATSPSLPTAVKAIGSAREPAVVHNTSSANATLTGSLGPLLPQSTLDLYDRFYSSLTATQPAQHQYQHQHHRSSSNNEHESHSEGDNAGASQANWSASLMLPDALASIGPSARRLLQLDAAQHEDGAATESTAAAAAAAGVVGGASATYGASEAWKMSSVCFGESHLTRLPVVPAAARTLPVYTGKMKSASSRRARGAKASNYAATTTLPTAASAAGVAASSQSSSQSPNRTVLVSQAPPDVRPPVLSSTITNGGSINAAPPLVTQLHSYIQRELIHSAAGGSSSGDGALVPSAIEQLGPYREAFRALCSAFPAYASLFSDIQSAYDNVIQAQAELLTDACAAVAVSDVERNTNQEQVTTLHGQVSDLQKELKSMEEALKTRALAEKQERQQQSARQRPRSAQLADAIELRRELEAAQQRVADLERNSQADLEKIVILIGAVRECDRRLKEYERIVASVTGQVSELDEFKRIAGEAQAELQLFRKKYADYVPVVDFQLMKEYLAAELESAQLQTRRWRRAAAVRGTQLDIMQCRLATLEEERANMIKAAEAAVDDNSASTGGDAAAAAATAAATAAQAYRALLTPRPSWAKLHAELPELAEFAADAGQLTTANDHNDDAVMATGAGEAAAALTRAKGLPTVKGPKETALQVEYLVQRIRALEAQIATQRHQQLQQQQQPSAAKQTSTQIADEPSASLRAASVLNNGPSAALENAESKNRNNSSAKPSAATTATAAPAATTKPEASALTRRASRRAQHRFSEGLQASSTGAHGGGVPALAAPLELPLVGLGYGPAVPVYLRASGVVARRPVAPSTIVSLVYHFFLDILPPYMDQQDQLRRDDEDGTKGDGDGDRIGACLHEYLRSEMTTREDLRGYDSVAHLFMNLIRDGEGSEWFCDALHVLLWTVRGVLPPRVAVDAAVVVAQVRRDVRALAKELQSSRLRRQALSECLQPVLELKSPSEVAELRAALGGETTFSVDTLCSDTHPFMEVLLVQECRASADLYVTFLSALSARATTMPSRATSATSRGTGSDKTAVASPPSPPQLAEGERVVTLADVAAAIEEVEPQTPAIVVRELSVNAASASGRQDFLKPPASPTGAAAAAVTGPNASAADGSIANKSISSTEEACVVVRLSDIVRAIAAAPLIRRTLRNSPENCVL